MMTLGIGALNANIKIKLYIFEASKLVTTQRLSNDVVFSV